ncbi:hypothetical protein ACIBQ1_14725 [Nonomuraea sp. NPDC050153]|uniref:hypothetical protein n=1 Tax=Nonomuraea sp. NPDC050153 TaxID=3364359 RepID=UPI0037A84EF0
MADVGDKRPSYDSPTTPFRKVVLPAEETVQIPRPPAAGPSVPLRPPAGNPPVQQPPARQSPPQQPPPAQPPADRGGPGPLPQPPMRQQPLYPPPSPPLPIPKPPRRGIGDIPIKAVYLLGAILATVLAVFLIFVVFSGDVPTNKQPVERVAPVAPVPSSGAPSGSVAPTATESPLVLPPVPKSKAYPTLSGTASVVTGLIGDTNAGITYPRLAAPWKAKSFPPFSIAQRIGKVAVPHTVIGSAMFPGDSPATKPSKDADYRELATQAARWSLRTQYPAGATLAWTASQKIPVGKGWTLGYQVTYTFNGKQQVAQAMVTVVEVGKTKPAMLLASIPETNKKYWRDINTLVQRVRPL